MFCSSCVSKNTSKTEYYQDFTELEIINRHNEDLVS